MMMKFLLFSLLYVATKASDVVILTSDNFDDETKIMSGGGDPWLVEFYAPWCGHCKKLQPVWEEVATALKGEVKVAKVDVTENRALGSRFDIKGFPTVKFFRNGEVYPYKGSRSKDAFMNYVRGGYEDVSGEQAPQQPSTFDMIVKSVTDPFKRAIRDVQKGKLLTPNTIIVALPALAVFMIVIVMVIIPDGSQEPRKRD